MRLLGFQSRYVAAILDGTKTSTIRLRRATALREGDVIGLRCRYDEPPFAVVRVLDVEPVTLSGLRREHAAAEGYSTVAELRADVRRLYGNAPLVRVRFELEPR